MDTKQHLHERPESACAKTISQRRYTIVFAIRKGYFSLARNLLSSGYDPNEVAESDKTKKNSSNLLRVYKRTQMGAEYRTEFARKRSKATEKGHKIAKCAALLLRL